MKIEADHPILGTNLVTQLEERRLSNWDVLRLMSNTSRRSRLQIISGPLQWIQYGCNCRAWCGSDCDFGDETGGAWVEATPTCRRHQCWGIYNRYGKGAFLSYPERETCPFCEAKGDCKWCPAARTMPVYEEDGAILTDDDFTTPSVDAPVGS